ncbi:Cephalosporin-C deacetylase [Streptomyces sp. RB5]|uniref:Cephalosporin-C deacetylase n=1 Tax=Streptomyces smaragdinus TaxID=2585196 RepID=A0A7K0CEY3_9ACTN|nr:acetylxylan esterase [Streptomyces smaragdinus]MQY12028.1 Cephalosporin-C deacetylase [Streptomyces smaragdinus]
MQPSDPAGELAPPAHEFPFDPTYGYGLPELLAVGAPPEPPGFEDFWRGLYDTARRVDPLPELGPPEAEVDGVLVSPVSFRSAGGRRIGGWLTAPADGRITRGCVATHGYGGRRAPEPGLPPVGAATIWPCLRGLGARSLFPDIPPDAGSHVLTGIEDRGTYVLGGCAADVWAAASALLYLLPAASGHLSYLGGSFGGGIGALALPWDDRFDAAALWVPTFGNHPLRLTMPCVGSGEAVRERATGDPAVLDVLPYFDAATAAARLTIPVHVGAALFDPAVPPPGQFAVYNALPAKRGLTVLRAGHFDHEGTAREDAALEEAQREFLTA